MRAVVRRYYGGKRTGADMVVVKVSPVWRRRCRRVRLPTVAAGSRCGVEFQQCCGRRQPDMAPRPRLLRHRRGPRISACMDERAANQSDIVVSTRMCRFLPLIFLPASYPPDRSSPAFCCARQCRFRRNVAARTRPRAAAPGRKSTTGPRKPVRRGHPRPSRSSRGPRFGDGRCSPQSTHPEHDGLQPEMLGGGQGTVRTQIAPANLSRRRRPALHGSVRRATFPLFPQEGTGFLAEAPCTWFGTYQEGEPNWTPTRCSGGSVVDVGEKPRETADWACAHIGIESEWLG